MITRREWLSVTAAAATSALGRWGPVAQDPAAGGAEDRIARIIRDYEQQGFHRTGTRVDQASADWLAVEVRRAGLIANHESFSLRRVDPVTGVLIVGDRRIDGIPLFDGAFTGAAGIRGRLGSLGSDAEIGLGETRPNAAAAGRLGEARRANQHKAIVCVTRGERPGLCPSNADSFLRPYGPPVLQVSSEHSPWLSEHAQRATAVEVVADVARADATADNVTATLSGIDASAAPLVISTPRSGWYSCASERGGGIACWLEAMQALRQDRPSRPIVFVAFSGHEVGNLGAHGFIGRRPGIVSRAAAWIHFGANIGAATDPGNRLAALTDDLDGMATRAMGESGLRVDQRIPRGAIPGGEAEVVHHGGGRYIAITGGNALFHNPEDRGPQAVDPVVIAKFSSAFIAVARSFAVA